MLDAKTILKGKYGGRAQTEFIWLRIGASGKLRSVKGRKFLDDQSGYLVLNKDAVPQICLLIWY